MEPQLRKYVVFHVKNEVSVVTPENITPRKFRYATAEGLKRYIANPANGRGYFYLTNPDAARLFEELKKSNKKFEISWGDNDNDPSVVEFRIDNLRILSFDSLPSLHFIIDNNKIHLYKLIAMLRL